MSAPAYSKAGLTRRRVWHECRQQQLAHYAASSFVVDVRGVQIAVAVLGKPGDGLGQEVGGDLRIGERAQSSRCGTTTEEGGQPTDVRPLAAIELMFIRTERGQLCRILGHVATDVSILGHGSQGQAVRL